MLAASSPGYAQDDLKAEGAKACGGDANRLCKHVLGQGEMIVLKCFQHRRTKLSRNCHTFLTRVRAVELRRGPAGFAAALLR